MQKDLEKHDFCLLLYNYIHGHTIGTISNEQTLPQKFKNGEKKPKATNMNRQNISVENVNTHIAE